MIWGGVLNSSYLLLFKTAYEIQAAVFTWNCCVLFVIVVPLHLSDLRIEINSVRKNSHLQKLVVKPDQLIKRRGKLGLIKVNTDLAGVKAWVGERMGTEVQVRASSYSITGHRSVLVWHVRHRGFIGDFLHENKFVSLMERRPISLRKFSKWRPMPRLCNRHWLVQWDRRLVVSWKSTRFAAR